MKSAARNILQISGLALGLIFSLAITAEAQNREKYIISAQAGGINYVIGNVTVQNLGAQRQRALALTDNLQTGDIVTTGAGGRVEVLLNPGSYMRVDENSEFELADASLDNLHVKLVRGKAVVEVLGAPGMELALGINTPQGETLIVRRGIYRFNVMPNATTEIVVRKGRLLYGNGTQTIVKDGQKVLLGNGLQVAKVDKKDQDPIDLWSKERGETLARANRRLERNSLMEAFENYRGWADMSAWGQTSPHLGGAGLWVYNARTRSYCYLATGPTSWSSPYGQSYTNGSGVYIPGVIGPRGQGEPATGSVPTRGSGPGGNDNPPRPERVPLHPQQPVQPPAPRVEQTESARPSRREESNPNR
jgi:hypothetical protein